MPLAPVDNQGTQLYYEDSGAPHGSSDYATLILAHGGVFHGAIYSRLFPYAAKHNLRLVAVNLRDYPGSTPHTPEELATLRGTDQDAKASLVTSCGLQIAAFVAWIINKEGLPPFSPSNESGSPSGGVAVLGWSWGNCITISFFAHIRDAPEDTRAVLESHMRAFIIFDALEYPSSLDHAQLDEVWTPVRDPALSAEQQGELFPHWVSGYYAHSPAALASLATLSRAELCAELAGDAAVDIKSTLDRMSPDELAATAEMSVTHRSHRPMHTVQRGVCADNLRAALHDSTICPRVRVSLVWCDMSVAETVLSSWTLARMVEREWPEGARKVEIVRMEGANHFPHWDEPERTMRCWASCL
ncbi:alpha/beta-hydrolase [Wolfiporia cocos MD-104 SS10]|uniref:Alpha/beta-hydrolase n=1 Tax=Wolfiporia cocos (strain MD-104) TaxID=742152 RepID=A0A2H3K159_WOLCO|nr:alpha/beta-hydrolase [Wolfiporia cocos MD-104 SS10]